MVRKKDIQKGSQVCSECANATWQWKKHSHLDLHGKPICLTCPHEEWWIIRGTINDQCQYYLKGEPKNSKNINPNVVG